MATRIIKKRIGGKYRIHLYTDSKEHYRFVLGAARRCEHRNDITEADLIRAMSDEELADFFAANDTMHWLNNLLEVGYAPTQNQRRVAKQGFYDKWIRYLTTEVGEDDDG